MENRVKGNYISFCVPVKQKTITSAGTNETTYIPAEGDKIAVRLVGYNVYRYEPTINESGYLVFEDNGKLDLGSYGLEVLIEQADGKSLRSYEPNMLCIVNSNGEASTTSANSAVAIDATLYAYTSATTGAVDGMSEAQVRALLASYATIASLSAYAKKTDIPSAYDDTEIRAELAQKANTSDIPQNYLTSSDLQGYAQESALNGKVDKINGKGLSTNDYTDADKAKVASALTEHQSLAGYATTTQLANKVDKVSGKGLSSNDYTDEDKEKLASLENNNVDLSNYATKSDLDAKQNKLTDRILLRVNGQHDDTLTIYGGVYSSSFGNNIGGYNMYFNKSGMYINNKQVATQEWVNENCDTSSLEERVDALEAIDHTQYLTEHQSLAGYAKSADVAKDYQPKGNYLTAHQDISGKADKEQVVTPTSGTATIEPNKFYKFGTTETLDISLAEPTDTTHTNHYHFSFTATDSTTLVMPYDVIWQGGVEPKRTSGNVYEVSILDNCASFMEFTPYDD